MKWQKLGKIFDPATVVLPNRCVDYAQSPQVLVFDDFVRIYFSTRERDARNGKYLSHVAFVDMAKDFAAVLRISNHTVVELGEFGTFDEHGIFPLNVVRVGGEVYGYTCGWSRRVSVSVETSIGLAISRDDGLTFQKIGAGPVLTASPKEPCLVGDGFVRHFGGLFHMWYIFGTGWKRYTDDAPPDRTYKIGHATSRDGVTWQKEEGRRIISDALHADESQALPTVIEIAGEYHMFFCYRQSHDFRTSKGRGYRLGYARSNDLSTWVRDDASAGIDVSPGSWDSDMMCYPHVFECDGSVYLLYNGDEFGKHGFGLARMC